MAVGVVVIVMAAALAVLLRASFAKRAAHTAPGVPPPTSSVTPSADPGSSPRALGASGASGVSPSAAGAVESATGFVNEWFGSVNLAVASGDTGVLAVLSDTTCALCQEAVRAIEASHKDGGRLRGGVYSVREVAVDSFFTAERPSLHVVLSSAPPGPPSAPPGR